MSAAAAHPGEDAGTARFAPTLLTNFPVNSGVAEAYRVIRTSMTMAEGFGRTGSVLVTSTARGEGKSVTCANLGIVLSRTDSTVVIVDADLRLPTMHHLFGIEPGAYAARIEAPAAGEDPADPEWAASLAVPVLDGLSVVPAGVDTDHPSELLGSEAFAAFLRALGERFDVVLVDSPPVGLVTDAAVVASLVDGVVFVLEQRRSQRRAARAAVRTLAAHANVLGVVVNRVRTRRSKVRGVRYGSTDGA